MKKFLLAFAASLTFAGNASGATLIVDTNGTLLGAAGVAVNGSSYDVSFLDGSCVDLFSGCDQSSDFIFTLAGEASNAAIALMNQVFIDGLSGNFDSDPETINGCTAASSCLAIIPYGFERGALSVALANNFFTEGADSNSLSRTSRTHDQTLSTGQVYAVFEVAGTTGVPEPATWAFMIFGFGAIGAAMRRQRKVNVKVSYA